MSTKRHRDIAFILLSIALFALLLVLLVKGDYGDAMGFAILAIPIYALIYAACDLKIEILSKNKSKSDNKENIDN